MRKAAGMTQRDLAQKMKREQSFVWRIEKGERRLDVLEFFWVCEALGQDAEIIYTELCKSFRKPLYIHEQPKLKIAAENHDKYGK